MKLHANIHNFTVPVSAVIACATAADRLKSLIKCTTKY